VVCEPSPPEPSVLFLNRSQVDRKVEYLDYVSGETSSAPHLLEDHRRVLGRVMGAKVSAEGLAELQKESAEDPDAAPPAPPAGGEAAGRAPAAEPAKRFGDFDLLAQLGAGGMGTVYLARQRSLGRLVALKVLPPGLATDEVAEARFRREVSAMARADHPNVVRVLQSGRTEGTWWFAMELVEGGDLREVAATLGRERSRSTLSESDFALAVATVSERRREDLRRAWLAAQGSATEGDEVPLAPRAPPPELGQGRTYFRRLGEVFRDAARGLQHLHERGILHRDVKPANVMVTRDEGRAVVMDLGLARIAEDASLTRADAMLGTIQYAAPEQLQHGLLTVDERSDVYGLGATLYELCTGRPPYQADSTEALVAKVLRVDPSPPRRVEATVPADLDAVVRKAMDRDPDRRYRNMSAFADDLDRFARGEPVVARPPGLGTLLRLWVSRHAPLAATAAAALLVIVVGTVVFLRSLQRQRDVARHERARADGLQEDAERDRDRAVAAEQEAREHLAVNYLWRAEETDSAAEALLFAARAVDLADRPEARGALLETLPRPHGPLWTSGTGVAGLMNLAFTPDGSAVATGGDAVRLWDVETGLLRGAFLFPDAFLVSVRFDPTGETLVAGCLDGQVLLWDAANPHTHPAVFHGHEGPVMDLCFLDEGAVLVSASADGTIRTWDVASFSALDVWRGHEARVQALAVSPDGTTVVSGGRDHSIRLWSPETGEETGRLEGHEGGVTYVGYASETQLVSTDGMGAIAWWDLPSRTRQRVVAGDGVAIHGASLTPDRRSLLTAHADGSVRVTDLASGTTSLRLAAHEGAAATVAVSPHGAIAATGSVDQQRLSLWDLASGKLLAHLEGHGKSVFDVAVVSGSRVASASEDGTIRLWDTQTGREAAVSERMDEAVFTLDAHPREDWLAAGLDDGSVRLFRADTLAEERIVGRHEAPVNRVVFSADGTSLASVSHDGYASIWDLTENRRRLHVHASDDILYGVALAPDGRAVATSGREPTIRLWDLVSGDEVLRLEGHTDEVVSLAFSPDGARLYSASSDRTVRVWDVASGREVARIPDHPGWVVDVAVSEDGRRIAVGVWDGTISVYDATSHEEVARLEGHAGCVWSVAFHAGGSRLFSGSADLTVRAWALDRVASPPRLVGTPKRLREVAFAPVGAILATGGEDPVIRLWDPASGALVRELVGHRVGIAGLAWDRTGARLVSVGADETVRVWEAGSGTLAATFPWAGPDYPWDAALSPGDRLLAVACESGVRLWDLTDGEIAGHLVTPPAPPAPPAIASAPGTPEEARSDTVAVEFTPDGRHCCAGTWDGWMLVWDVAEGRVVRTWRADDSALFDAVVSPSGTHVATCGADPTVRIWRIETGEETVRLEGHRLPVVAAAWSPDGRYLHTCSSDHTVRVWDAEAAVEVARFTLPTDQAEKVAVDASGTRLAAVGTTGATYLWSLEGLAWPAGSCLTRAEARCGFSLDPPFDVRPPTTEHLLRVEGR
jgi:WD40 repeat protein/serine/threonine protein kinase